MSLQICVATLQNERYLWRYIQSVSQVFYLPCVDAWALPPSWLSLAVLYSVVSRFLTRLFSRKWWWWLSICKALVERSKHPREAMLVAHTGAACLPDDKQRHTHTGGGWGGEETHTVWMMVQSLIWKRVSLKMPAKVSIKTPEDSLIQLFKAVHSIAWVRKLVNRKEKKEKKTELLC